MACLRPRDRGRAPCCGNSHVSDAVVHAVAHRLRIRRSPWLRPICFWQAPTFGRHSASKTRVNALVATCGAAKPAVRHVLTMSNSPAGKRQRSGKSLGTRPPSVLSASKAIEEGEAPQSAGAEPPHPVATLRSGQSLHRKGLPAHDAGRRALRRFTAVISVEPRSTRSGRACVPARIAHRSSSRLPAHGSLCP